MKTIEYSIPVIVQSGINSAEVTQFLPAGRIVGIHAIYDDLHNDDMVRLAVKDFAGQELSRMQAIGAYKQRQGGSFLESIKPMPVDAGKNFTVVVQSNSNFSADTNIDLIFVYAEL